MSNVGLELSGFSDPNLNWKLSSKSKKRASRRRRTSFTGVIVNLPTLESSNFSQNPIGKGPKKIESSRKKSATKSQKRIEDPDDKGRSRVGSNRKKSAAKNSNESRSLINKKPRKLGDMPVSESEKHGVITLGGHFSDTQKVIPIKKRNIRLICSAPPLQFPFHLDGPGNQPESGQGKFAPDGDTNPMEIKQENYEVPDFSGISLLASAACDSSVTYEIMNTEGSGSRGSEGDGTSWGTGSCSPFDIKEERLFSTAGYFNVKSNDASSLINVQDTVNGTEVLTKSVKFDWDLNEPIKLWDDSLDETVNAKPLVADIKVEHDYCDGIVNEPYCSEAGLSDAKHAHKLLASGVGLGTVMDGHALGGSKVLEKLAEHGEEKDCVPISIVDASTQEESQLKFSPVVKTYFAKEAEQTSQARGTPERGSFLNAFTLEKERADAYSPCMITGAETETRSPHLIPTEDAIADSTTVVSRSLPDMVRRSTAIILEEKKDKVSVAGPDVNNGVCLFTKVETNANKYVSVCSGSDMQKTDQLAMLSHLAEDASDALLDRTDGFLAHANGTSGLDHDGNSKQEISSSDSHPFTCIRSSNHDALSSGSTSAARHVTSTIDTKMKNNCSVMADENSNTSRSDDSHHIVSNSSTNDSSDKLPWVTVAPPTDGALSSHGTCKSNVNSPGEVALEDHADCGYDSHASQTGTDQVSGLEKVDIPSDDDSQYEDGEFRGSININDWGEDEAEDEMNYGSDNREMGAEAAAIHIDNAKCRNMRLSEVGFANRDIRLVARDVQDDASPFMRSPSINDARESGCRKIISRKFTKNGDEIKKYTHISRGSDDTGKSLRSASLGFKSLEWDKWPEGRRSYGDGTMDSRADLDNENQTTVTLNTSNVGLSLRSAVGMTSRKYLPSQIERTRFSDVSHGRERYYANANRFGGDDEQDFKFRDVNIRRSFRSSIPSQPLHSKGQREIRVDSRNHWALESRDSPGYHDPHNFTPSGSKTAVTAVTAKLESNGFRITSDGTLFKAGGRRRPGCLPTQSANVSSQRTCHSVRRRSPIGKDGSFLMQRGFESPRLLSPDRHINSRARTDVYGTGLAKRGCREKYHIIEPKHGPFYRRERGFSPYRRPLFLSRSRTRSPSRSSRPSRSRSPSHMWMHSGKSNDRGMDRSHALRRHSRSPYFKPEVMEEKIRSRMRERSRSPHQRSGFKRIRGYTPTRNVTSPLRTSRLTDERIRSPNQFRERKYKSSASRRVYSRGSSQDRRFDPMDSLERSKPDECYRPMHSGRFLDSVLLPSSGPKHDTSQRGHAKHDTSQRGHGDRCEILHLPRQCDIDGNKEELQNDVEDDGPRAHNPPPRIFSELHRKESTAGFDKSTDSRLRSSSPKASEGEYLDTVKMERTALA